MKNNEVYIIGGGSSLIGFDFSKLENKTTITVNKGITYVPNLNYFVTMDFTALKKIPPIEGSKATKIFIANLAESCLQEKDGQLVDVRFGLVYKLEDFDMIIKSRKKDGIGYDFKDFRNGENSGFCALQLAVILGYETIYLYGMDLTIGKETHFHGGYGQAKDKFQKKLDLYYSYFEQAIKKIKDEHKIKIYSCSKTSRLNSLIEYRNVC